MPQEGPGQARDGKHGVSRPLGQDSKASTPRHQSGVTQRTYAKDQGEAKGSRSGWPAGQHKKEQLQRDGDNVMSEHENWVSVGSVFFSRASSGE